MNKYASVDILYYVATTALGPILYIIIIVHLVAFTTQ